MWPTWLRTLFPRHTSRPAARRPGTVPPAVRGSLVQLEDRVTPAISLLSFTRQVPTAAATNADALVFRATFSEDVQGVDPADFAVNGATTAAVAATAKVGTGNLWDVTVSGGDLAGFNGLVGLDVAAGVTITDAATGTMSLPAAEPPTDDVFTLDNAPPTADIVDITPDPRATAVGTVTINFDQAVTGVDVTDFTLTRDAAAVSLAGLTVGGGGVAYTLDLTTVTGTPGTYVFTLVAAGSGIQDAAGNALAADASDTWTRVPDVSVAVAGSPATEAGGALTYTLSRTGPTAAALTVNVSFGGTATLGTDYTQAGVTIAVGNTGTVTFAAGSPTATVVVTGQDDPVVEGNETVSLTVAPESPLATYNVTAGTATGTLTDNDTATITLVGGSAPESSAAVPFTVMLSAPVSTDVTVTFDTLSTGTATPGTDFAAVAGLSVTIPANTTSMAVAVPLGADDQRLEGPESVNAKISNVTGGGSAVTLGTAAASGTISDNESATASLDSAGTALNEDNAAVPIGVTLTVTSGGGTGTLGIDTAVTVRVADVGTGTATAGTDYTFTNPTNFVFTGDGATFTGTATVTLVEDLANEGTEAAAFNLSVPSGPAVVGGTTTFNLTIVDDDDTGSLTFDATAPGTYQFVRNGANVDLLFGAGPGATKVASAAFGTTRIVFNGTNGNDTLLLNFSAGNVLPGSGIVFNGRGQTGTPGDTVRVVNTTGTAFSTVTFNYLNASAGDIVFAGLGTFTYTGLEPIDMTGSTIADLVFNLPAGPSNAVLEDDAGAAVGVSQLRSANATFETTTFANPSGSVTVNAKNAAADTLVVTAVPDLTATLKLGVPTPFNSITVSGPITSTGSVTLAAGTIAINAAVTAATSITLVATTSASQTAAGVLATPALILGVTGNAGTYALAAANNDSNTLAATTTGGVSFADADDLTVNVTKVGGAFAVTAQTALTLAQDVTAGSAQFKGGDSIALSTGATLSVTGAAALEVDTIGAADAAGGTISLLGTNVMAPGGVTLTGGAEADTFTVAKVTAAVAITGNGPVGPVTPGDRVVFDGGNTAGFQQTGAGASLGGGPITFTGIESLVVRNVTAVVVTGTAGDDAVTLETDPTATLGGNPNPDLGKSSYVFVANGAAQPRTYLPPALGAFTFNSGTGVDRLTVRLKAGEGFQVGAIGFNGQGAAAADKDLVEVLGSAIVDPTGTAGGQAAAANLRAGAAAGGGTVAVVGKAPLLTFTGATAANLAGFTAATVAFADGGVKADVAAGFKFNADGSASAVKAIRFTPSAGGPAFVPVAVWKNGLAALSTAAVAGADVITVLGTGDKADHLNTNLQFSTGADAGDAINVTGAVSVANAFTATTTTLAVAAGGSIAAGGAVTLVAAGSATINGNVSAGTAAAVTTGPDTAADQPLTVGAGVTIQAAAGNVTLTSADGVLAAGATLLAPAGTVVIVADAGSTDPQGAVVDLVGATLTTATVTGNTGDDEFRVSAGYTSPVLVDGVAGNDVLRVAGGTVTVTQATVTGAGQPLAFQNIDVLNLDGAGTGPANAATVVTLLGGAGADTATLAKTATEFSISLNTFPILASKLATFTFNGQAGNDGLFLTFTAAGSPIPAGGVTAVGGNGSDAVTVTGTGAEAAAFTTGAAKSGTLAVGGGQVTLTAIDDLALSKLNAATLIYAGANDALAVGGGAAVVVSGTSGGAAVTRVAVLSTGSLAVNSAPADGDDAVTVGGIGAAANVSNLSINTGPAGADAVTVTGAVAIAGTFDVTTQAATVAAGGSVSAGTVTITTRGAVDIGGSVTAAGDVTVAAIDAAGDQSVTVRAGGSLAAGGALVVRAGDDLTVQAAGVLSAGTTVTLTIDDGNADAGVGATATLTGATISKGTATVTGGPDNDIFLVTGYDVPLTVDGKGQVSASGDALTFDAGTADVSATANSFTAAGKAAVTYTDIETVTLANNIKAAVTVNGTGVDDILTVRLAGGSFQYQLQTLPGQPQPNVTLAAVPASFQFNGLAGADTLVVDLSAGNPVPAGGITFDGGAGGDKGVGVRGNKADAVYTSDGNGTSGRVDVGQLDGNGQLTNVRTVRFQGLDAATSQVDISDMASVTVRSGAGKDALTVNAGAAPTDGNVPALTFTGPNNDFVAAGVYRTPSVTLDTGDGDDAVTVAGGNASSGITDLTITTGAGTDAVTVTGSVTVARNLAVTTGTTTVLNGANVTAGGGLTLTNGTAVNLGAATLTAGTTFAQGGGAPVRLTSTTPTTTVQAAADVQFSGTVDGPGGLTVNAAGVTTFTKAVGGTTPLASVTTDQPGSTEARGGTVRTAGAQQFNDPVRYTASTTFANSGSPITFGGSLTPTADGLTLSVGGAGSDLTFNGDVGAAKAGSVTITDGRAVLFQGTVTSAAAVTVTNAQDLTFRGTVTAAAAVTVTNAQNVVFARVAAADLVVGNAGNVTLGGDVSVSTFRQDNGSGTTTVTAPLTATGGTAVTNGYTAGGAVNIKTNKAVFAADLTAANNPIVLQLANGASQTAGRLKTTQLYLNGSGTFDLNSAANLLTAGNPNNPQSPGELFVDLAGGLLRVRDDLLVLRFQDTSRPAVSVPGGKVFLTTNGDFNAIDPSATAANAGAFLVPLVAASGGSVQVFPGASRPLGDPTSTTVTYVAEASAATFTLGTVADGKSPENNVSNDIFIVRPSKGAPLTVNGNAPVGGQTLNNKSLAPFDTLVQQFAGINVLNLATPAQGNGTFTFDQGFQPLTFTSIETLGGTRLEAFAVQTGPAAGPNNNKNAYAIRFRVSSTSPLGPQQGNISSIPGDLSGAGAINNSFVVSPALQSPDAPFGPPKITAADVDGDGTPDLIVANGPGDTPLVTVLRGSKLLDTTLRGQINLNALTSDLLITQFFAYEVTFRGGVNVAAADLDGDGKAEIVTGAGPGGGPRVLVWKIDTTATGQGVFNNAVVPGKFDPTTGKTPPLIPFLGGKADFLPYDPVLDATFRGGVNVAIGDATGDGTPDLVIGAGVGGGPRVTVFDGKTGLITRDFFAYESQFRGGVLVDVGRFNDDALADIVTAPGAGGGPRVKVFRGVDQATYAAAAGPGGVDASRFVVADFFAFPTESGLLSGVGAQTGVGGVAFGGSSNGTANRRAILVSTARGRAVDIVRFNVKPDGTLDTANPDPLFQDILNNAPTNDPDFFRRQQITLPDSSTQVDSSLDTLRDGATVGGFNSTGPTTTGQ